MSPLVWTNLYPALGHVFQVLLFGFLAAQISRYHESFPNDRIALKVVAWTSFLLSMALTIMVLFEIAIHVLAPNAFWPVMFDGMDSCIIYLNKWILFPIILLNGFVMFISQIFFSWRVCEISQKAWLQNIIYTLSVLQLGGCVAHSIFNQSSFHYISVYDYFHFTWIASNIACNLSITVSMIWALRQARGAAATFKPMKTMLGKILTFTLGTGLVTTIWMACQLILQISLGQDEDHFVAYAIFFYPSGKLYAIWLLATLNARSSFNKYLPSLVDATNLPNFVGEVHFKYYTVKGTEVVIYMTTNGLTSHGGSLEVESDSYSSDPGCTGKQSQDLLV